MTANRFNFRYWDGQHMMFIGIGTLGYGSHGEIDLEEGMLMQSTGLLDKNGVEIFEGDIISDLDDIPVNCCRIGVVEWGEARFFWAPGEEWGEICANNVIIIGNIYENKDLLK